jgi:hypothetical protein
MSGDASWRSLEPVANWPEYRPAALLQALVEGGVDFVIIGGVGVVLQAMPRFTKDLDICYSTEQGNLEALGNVLVGLTARLRGIPEEVPFVPDERSLRHTQILCLTNPDGAPPYEILHERADIFELGGQRVRTASIEDLLAMKRAAGRPQDLIDIESLEVARERSQG